MTSPKKTKVLYLITKSNWGGAQRYVYDLATHLDRERFEPVVALGGNGTLAEMLHHAEIRTIHITALERDIKLRKEFALCGELWRILRAERPDVLHLNSSKAGGLGALLGRLRRIPRVIFTAHGWFFNEDRPWWQRVTTKFLHWITVLLAHRTIAVSRAIVTQMNWPGAERRMKVINPGRTIGVMYAHQEARAALTEYAPALNDGSPKRQLWIGTIAELHPVKRLDVLIASVADLIKEEPRIRCVIMGEGQERDTLTKQIEAHHLTNHVFLLGTVPEAARFLHALDYFVLPSRSEAYGYAVHEAGLARLPVVASDVGGLRDVVTNTESGLLVPPGDVAALTQALRTLLRDRDYVEQLRRTLHERVKNRTVEKMTNTTVALYTL